MDPPHQSSEVYLHGIASFELPKGLEPVLSPHHKTITFMAQLYLCTLKAVNVISPLMDSVKHILIL